MSSKSVILAAAACLGTMLCAPTPVWAQTPGGGAASGASASTGKPAAGVTDAQKQAARTHYGNGQKAETACRWEEAYTEYGAALGEVEQWQIEGALAEAARRIGKHAEAARRFRHVLADPEAQKALAADPKLKAKIEEGYANAKKHAGLLKVEGPAGASVSVDGSVVGTLPVGEETFVDAGTHVVEGRKEGKLVSRMFVQVGTGQTGRIELIEGRIVKAAVGAPGGEEEESEGDGEERAAGKGGGTGPVQEVKGGPNWGLAFGLAGVALAGAAAGGVLWGLSGSSGDKAALGLREIEAKNGYGSNFCRINSGDAACVQVGNDLNNQDNLQTAATAAWGVAGAAVAGAVIVVLVTGREPRKTGVRAIPLVGSSQAGFVVEDLS
ncbi:MAG: hypothetical protein R3F14_24070 [Polyangiaceae bacterium]